MATIRRLKTNVRVPVKLDEKVQQNIVDYINNVLEGHSFSMARDRYEKIDRAYYLESMLYDEHGQPIKKVDWEMPIIKPDIDSAHSFMLNTFISNNEVFQVVPPPGQEEAAHQFQAVIEENSRQTGWARHLALFFKDGLKYNIHALEVEWRRRQIFDVETDTTANNASNAKLETTERAGNEFKRINPYNLVYDHSVDIPEVHTKGTYVGYFERLSMTQLYQLITDLKFDNQSVMNETREMWESAPLHNRYYHPDILKDVDKSENGWDTFWHAQSNSLNNIDAKKYDYAGYYEVTCMYFRIIPSMLGMNVPSKDSIQIWKFIIINGQYLLYAERQSNAHNMFNIVVGQPNEDGLRAESKSIAESLHPFQKLATEFQQARLAALYRGIDDRALYDSTRISKRDLDGKNPRGKIPVRPSIQGARLADAYYAIPFNDTASQYLSDEVQKLRAYANEVSGSNNPARGQFQRGNKTKFEYQDVMSNASALHLAMGLMIDSQTLQPIKHMIKANVLQYQPYSVLLNPEDNTEIEVRPEELRKIIVEFKLADGLNPIESLVPEDALREALIFLAQSPQMQLQYDIGKFFSYLLGLRIDISKFKLDEQQMQANIQQQRALAGRGNEQQQQQPV